MHDIYETFYQMGSNVSSTAEKVMPMQEGVLLFEWLAYSGTARHLHNFNPGASTMADQIQAVRTKLLKDDANDLLRMPSCAPPLRDGADDPDSSGDDRDSPPSWAAADEGARQLEAVAARLLAQSRQAIQSAQQTLQETATNCQANLQSLGTLLQAVSLQQTAAGEVSLQTAAGEHGLPRSSSGGSLQLAPWQQPSGGGGGEQAAPWDLVPRAWRDGDEQQQPPSASGSSNSLVLFARKANGGLLPERPGGSSGENGTGGEGGGGGYQQMADYLDLLHRRRPAARSLRDPGRSVAIVTTASLPWMTGTAVNPLLRAAYLANNEERQVTLLLPPWLSRPDQQLVLPNTVTFDSPADQEAFVGEWAQKRTGLACGFKVRFYPGRYAPEKGSILPVGDITQYIPDAEADVAVLEEPEHLNWYHHGRRWTDKFQHVVGVMHTNYLDYARREERGHIKEALLRHINAWVCRIYCHKVIKLSDAVQPLPREETMFVHGVSPNFLRVGEAKAAAAAQGARAWSKGAYFLGKVLWAKGYTELLERLNEHAAATGDNVEVDVYGAGPDLPAVQQEAASRRLNLHFNGPRDHADASLADYKVFINPSLSDVVATTTAEALAMGKWVVCAEHPSNEFFAQFPNCLVYRTPDEFSRCLRHAMARDPAPLSAEQLHRLTWEDATERFLQVAELGRPPQPQEQLLDNLLAAAHSALTGVEGLRVLAGAGAGTRDSPASVTAYTPSESDVGGWFDDASRAKRAYGGGGAVGASAAGEQPRRRQAQQAQQQQQQQRQQAPPGPARAGAAAPAAAEAAGRQGARQR
ncbi:DGD1 [Scenedesmus sp. PABB004]|nr:DGD1 [Scenedesmus sp. PABB004]